MYKWWASSSSSSVCLLRGPTLHCLVCSPPTWWSRRSPLIIDLLDTDGIFNLIRNLRVNLAKLCVVDLQCINFCYLESPLDSKEIQPVHPKRNQSWIFIARTDAEAETPTLWPPDAKSGLTGKDPGAGKDWRWEEQGTTEDEMVGWHHRPSGHEFEWGLGAGDAQGGLLLPSPLSSTEPVESYFLVSFWPVSGLCPLSLSRRQQHLLWFPCLQSCFPPILPLKGRTDNLQKTL